MFGLFEGVRKIDGEEFRLEGEFSDVGEAKAWCAHYNSYNYKARVIPNASHQTFQVWVSTYPASAGAAPQQQAEKQG